MADRFPPFGTVPTRPRCHYCGGVIVVDLHADDDLWEAVMREKFGTGYACINCFASRADEKLIDWAPHVRLVPLSLAWQMRVQEGASKVTQATAPLEDCACGDPSDPTFHHGRKHCYKQCATAPEPRQDHESVVEAIATHIDGWRSATFGWQDDPDPSVAARNRENAIQAHAAECLRRIRETLALGVPDLRAALLRIRAGIAGDRCDGESEWASGVNSARKNHLALVDAVLADVGVDVFPGGQDG